MKTSRVGIVILNYQTYDLTIDCVSKLSNIDYDDFFVVIVDNNSPNGSKKILKQKYEMGNELPFKTYFIASDINGGYSYGNNLGMKKARELGAEYIIIMNNDVRIIDNDFIKRMLLVMNKDKNIALLGPGIIENNLLQLPAYKRRPSGTYYILNNLFWPVFITVNKLKRIRYQEQKKLIKVYSVAGCCLMLRTELIKEVGWLDENVFLYGEELIIGEKLHKANYSAFYFPKTKVVHMHSRTISASLDYQQKIRAMEESNMYYLDNYREDIKPYVKYMIRLTRYIKIKLYIPLINRIKHIINRIKDITSKED